MSRTIHEAAIADKHEQWMATYGRKYEESLEKEKRFKIFKDNLEYIESFNKAGNKSYKLGLNEFSDMSRDEFLATHTGYKIPPHPSTSTSFKYESFSDVPTNLDWREKGAVTPVKNQQQCGCCWAFSAVAAIEGITQIKTGKLISLSEQQIIDCVTSGNRGCEGNWMMNAFEYVAQNQGISREENYPYLAMEQVCDMQKSANPAATISSYEMVPQNDEEALLKTVANQPVSVAINTDNPSFMYYKSGVLMEDCGTSRLHALTIVGFGTDSEYGTDYWLIKNSWGQTWGEKGYIKIQRNVGLCGLAKYASYPVA
ncbi:hypothetical protein COLO4_03609 [Corchorus olitorius]|uniref:Peptidase C1A papain C-terminal domain-containing protein n=1 Tax=Corchorus olitorius TaxID=93759 RepID=A0A1R3KXV0_9ROSI|nr:hypothetical protein COLO4_03609 [Corchorus olitorius]